MSGSYRVGLDIGGTFTDFMLWRDGSNELRAHKRLTTPDDPAEGALAGLRELLAAAAVSLADCTALVHGTTLVTNAVIERTGAPTALLTTRGFRDVLEMGREQRYDIHDLFLRYPEPLVPRRWRLEVEERMTAAGEPLATPDLEAVRAQAAAAVDAGIEAVAVCFLHAYRNPAHERAVAELLRREFPTLSVSVSSEVAPEIREYERTSTTVCNAYVQPLVDRYLRRLEDELHRDGFAGRFFLVQSSGGLISPEAARAFPVRLLESGPAGGAIVAAALARSIDVPDVVAFDMGGTTAKLSLVRDGRPDTAAEMEAARVHRFRCGSGLPIKTPVVALIEIGAGGGSIARADELGLLRVGPRSAGADPGPACYALGGEEPTVTDACLLLGYLDPASFLGGAMPLDPEAARRAFGPLGQALDLDTVAAAWGVYRIVCENMAGAARIHIIEQGEDPRRFPLIAFGGAGPVHAARVARILGAPEVIVPPDAGVASALGFLVAPVSFELSRSAPAELRALAWDEIDRLYGEMAERARSILAGADVPPGEMRFERWAEMRLSGQFHDIDAPLPDGPLTAETAGPLAAAFAAAYERRYHAMPEGYEPMALNWRLRASGPAAELPSGTPAPDAAGETAVVPTGRRPAYFPESGGYVETPAYDRAALPVGGTLDGPAIVEERESTTVVGPADRVRVDAHRNLRISIGVQA
jgi:5-oxoprolinase (ATP-hydrolysing)/N-methylhydantoinase A